MKYFIFLLFLSSIICYQKYNFIVESPNSVTSFQNNTYLGPFLPGLLKLSIIVNISTVGGYTATGSISSFFIATVPPSEIGQVFNIISNQTQFFDESTSISCSGDTWYSYGCVKSSSYYLQNNYQYACSSGQLACISNGYSSNLINATSSCSTTFSNNAPTTLQITTKKQINSNCKNTNILSTTLSTNYLPTSGVQLYSLPINMVRTHSVFKGSYIIDTMNYPEFWIDFYSNLNVNNVLQYLVYLKLDYILKYDFDDDVKFL